MFLGLLEYVCVLKFTVNHCSVYLPSYFMTGIIGKYNDFSFVFEINKKYFKFKPKLKFSVGDLKADFLFIIIEKLVIVFSKSRKKV